MNDSATLAECQGLMRELGHVVGHILATAVPPVEIDGGPQEGIPAEFLNDLTECLMIFHAEVVQSWIDAGSEREVTMEDEGLFLAIKASLHGWSTAWNE